MGIDAIGRAGDQGAEFLLLVDEQVAHIVRQDGFNLIHLINKGLVQHRDPEGVAHLQFVQIREQLCAGQAPMCRDSRMGTLSCNRKAAALNVSAGMVQHRGVRAVIDGQLHLNLVDIYIADDAIADGIEAIIVSADLLVFRQRE